MDIKNVELFLINHTKEEVKEFLDMLIQKSNNYIEKSSKLFGWLIAFLLLNISITYGSIQSLTIRPVSIANIPEIKLFIPFIILALHLIIFINTYKISIIRDHITFILICLTNRETEINSSTIEMYEELAHDFTESSFIEDVLYSVENLKLGMKITWLRYNKDKR
jgi:hypothetical protein